MIEQLRNIAIIAHVDHGKTTLVDKLLRQSQTLADREELQDRAMDSNPQERERGITILAKNTAILWNGYRINIVDTPGHADFGGEVERVLSMVDSVLLLVDAVDGPMPQTRFVTRKAFDHGLKPIVVINKVDRDGARPHFAVEATFDLMDSLGASNEQLDFPIIFASALLGRAGYAPEALADTMQPLFETIVARCPPPDVDRAGPLQLQVSALDYSSYVGAIGIGRIKRGRITRNSPVVVVGADGSIRNERVMQVYAFLGLKRTEVAEAWAGDIIAFAGLDHPRISDTLCDPARPESLPALTVDEPTIQMSFETNDSPFAGRDGKFLTSRQLRERLYREAVHNVALRVEDTEDPERFLVSGRGELHLSVFLETMRREGYEMAVSRPKVITRLREDGVVEEPWEMVALDVETRHQGATMEQLGTRGGELLDMRPDGKGRVRLDYRVPSRGLIGFQSDFRSMTSGTGLMHHVFDRYAPVRSGSLAQRNSGVLISNGTGKALAYALYKLEERGRLFTAHGDEVYGGQVIGIHSRENDLTVNPLKAKQLTNIRAASKDENVVLSSPIRLTLEQALEFIDDDELVEITPGAIRVRKRFLKEHERKKASRSEE